MDYIYNVRVQTAASAAVSAHLRACALERGLLSLGVRGRLGCGNSVATDLGRGQLPRGAARQETLYHAVQRELQARQDAARGEGIGGVGQVSPCFSTQAASLSLSNSRGRQA